MYEIVPGDFGKPSATQARVALVSAQNHSTEWELVDEVQPAGTLNETIAHLVKHVVEPNGAPICIFMPLVEAVLAKQAALNERHLAAIKGIET